MASLPVGTVTFLFSDIEGSTRHLQELDDEYLPLLETHRRLLRAAFAKGAEVGTEGDSFFVAFADAAEAVAAAVTAQQALAAEPWPAGHPVRVRMGLHTGRGTVSPGGGYVGLDVHRAARIAAAGHGGQVLLSGSTAALTMGSLPAGTTIRTLGTYRLKDIATPERISELVIAGLPGDFPPLKTADRAQTNVHLPLTSFVGRQRELELVRRLIAAHRLVTLVGTGGTGKTRLLLHAAIAVRDDWPDGVWLAELAPISDPAQLLPTVVRAVGARDDPGRPLLETLVDFLRPKRLLLLLDNCEHLVAPVARLAADLLHECPDLTLVATSREGLGVDGETLYQVPSLAVLAADAPPAGDGLELARDTIAQAPATRLFLDRASATGAALEPSIEDLRAIADICRHLDGIPLAIELAAARVAVMSIAEIADRLGDRFRLLTGGARTVMPRQQTLEAAIDWSWALLMEDERIVLRRLAVFAGGWDAAAAAAVALDPDQGRDDEERVVAVLDALGRLVSKSLLLVERGTPTRYHALESIRQYARERLFEAGEGEVIRSRHLRYFLDLAEAVAPRLSGREMPAALDRLDADREDLAAAIDWAFEVDTEAALRLCLARVAYDRARTLTSGFALLSRAVEHVDRLPDWRTSPLAASILAAAAMAAWMVGSAPRGEPWATTAVEIARSSGDPKALADALIARASIAIRVRRFDGVMDWVTEAATLAGEAADHTSIVFAYAGIGMWQAESGDMAGALRSVELAEEAAARSGSPQVIGFTALGRGRVEGITGRMAESRQAFATAVASYDAIGDGALSLVARSDLAHMLRLNGELDEAAAAYRETLPEWLHTGNRGAIANQLESAAFLAAADHPVEATRLLAAAAVIRSEADAPMLVFEQREADAALERLRVALDDRMFERAQADGRAMSLETAVSAAMTLLLDAPGQRVGAPRG